ncbi:MAG: ABC transporter ATP-binding protein [Sphingobacteriales bacterium]|jgi:peptide/nickel transport system ATP-binding protein|nr:ABC transporter ATP-binding protein [Sphingobacteriales bacterium]MBP9141163.1 ABC transporter ATP-binding protein [Chitinophagales bacterium]MDA0198336.1 ABC transporter ATP-binding protein [Bacteroidota bacterium]MBK7527940.1 ABC transporter ATP-binding protein [Sphingobacteriales bacterium]MBK8678926.1 ABC transporter ATP-binding protein [Sphingobacteriales bacterium]
MSNNSSVILDVKNLETQFISDGNLVKAVDNVSFQVKRGETIGIVGESGSGKSVTSLSVMRLIPNPPGRIAGGEIIYTKRDGSTIDLLTLPITEMPKYRGNDIAMIFQEPMTSLNPVYRCGQQVVEAIMLHQKVNSAQAKDITLALFEQVRLPNPARIFAAYPHELSGGQKQRVMIAMAMSCNPSILIADEPTTALDVTVQKRILELMNDLKQKMDGAIMFITHDLGVIGEIADRVLVMYKGKIVEQGNVLDIFKNPQHPYTKGLLACRPPLGRRLRKLPVIADFMDVSSEGTVTEKANSVEQVITNVEVKESETAQRLVKLTEQAPLLEIKNLKTYFPASKNFFGKVLSWVKAVDDVSINVYPGETLGLVGESGCGKTTLGRTILRLAPATEGSIIYKGRSVLDLNKSDMKDLRREMQIIFQDPYSSLNPRMTIGDAIIEPMEIHGLHNNKKERREKAADLLRTVAMNPDHLNRYPHEFSGGQRQRICIARTLALNPSFIICDESVSALDVSVQAQVLNLLIDLREKFGFTYIFISHDLSVVKFMSDRMVVMNAGKIEEVGAADEIYNNPQRDYTKKLIDAIPKGDVATIEQRLKI